MAQIATTEADRTAAVTAWGETIPASATDVPADLPTKPRNRTLHLIEQTAATAKNMVGTAVPDGAKRGLLLPTTQAALEMVKVGGAVVGFWFQRGTEQLVHTSQTLKQLAAARDWQEALEIQNSFLRDGLSQLNDGMSRYASEAGRIVARSRQARTGGSAATAHSR